MSTRNHNNFLSTANDYPIQTSSTTSLNVILFNHFPQENNILIFVSVNEMFRANFFTVLNYFLPILDQDNDTLFFYHFRGCRNLNAVTIISY